MSFFATPPTKDLVPQPQAIDAEVAKGEQYRKLNRRAGFMSTIFNRGRQTQPVGDGGQTAG